MPYYYVFPFGTDADDLTAIPTAAAVDGSVSYQNGWTVPYQYDLQTNPSALPIPRGQMNELFLQITENIQWLQQYGSPAWITSADNLGTPYPYKVNARVYYGGLVYESQVSGNTSTPGTDANWIVISGGADGVQIGMITIWPAAGSPAGRYLFCDGSSISRTTYASLYAVLNPTQNGTLINTSVTVTGLTSTADMYVGMHIEGAGIPAATTIATIVSGSSITMSNAATAGGTVAIRFFQYGNGDGSTTFNIPNGQTRAFVGSGGAGITIGATTYKAPGQSCGAQGYDLQVSDMPNHTHDPDMTLDPGNQYLYLRHTSSGGFLGFDPGATDIYAGSYTGNVTGYTTQTQTTLIQPSMLVKYFIRY